MRTFLFGFLLLVQQLPALAADAKKGSSDLKRALGDKSAGPVLIRSNSLSLDSKKRVFSYRDYVEITRGDLTITGDTVTGLYDENNQILSLECIGNVVITRGEALRATSNRAHYDVPRGVIVLTEGPELNDKGNVLNADKVTVYVEEDRSEAEGNVRVKVMKADESAIRGGAESGGKR